MQVFIYAKPHNMAKVYAALIAAIPALAPQPSAAGAVSPITVESNGASLRLTFPDGIDAAKVAAVVAAADPTPTPTVPTARQAARAALAAGNSIADVKAALLAYMDAG